MEAKEIFAKRLNQARLIKGLSLEQLARSVVPSVSRQAIFKYEKGQSMPDSRMLISLSKVLGVKPDYFFRPFTAVVDRVMFRKKGKFSERESAAVKERVKETLERYLEVEQLCGVSSEFSLNRIPVSGEEDAVAASVSARAFLGLGLDGISSVVDVLEEAGVKIIEIEEESSFEGLSGYANDNVPLIVINASLPDEQKRFTLLHEFGHLVMDFDGNMSSGRMEHLCNVFASEMLLPASVITARIGKRRHDISLAELTDIQRRYGISIDVIMSSLHRIGVISGRRYEGYLNKKRTYRDFSNLVKPSIIPVETSGRFVRMVYRALADEIISMSKAASLLNVSVSDVKSHLQLV